MFIYLAVIFKQINHTHFMYRYFYTYYKFKCIFKAIPILNINNTMVGSIRSSTAYIYIYI